MTKTAQHSDGQTRRQSGIETFITNIVGFTSVVILQIFLLPLYGIPVNMPLILSLTLLATLIAMPRIYLLRRLFNLWHRGGYQSRWLSMVEIAIDLVVGYGMTVLMLTVVFPLAGYQVSLSSNAQISAIFYVFAYLRRFILRRFFNWVWAKG